jgi:hypothetical protein
VSSQQCTRQSASSWVCVLAENVPHVQPNCVVSGAVAISFVAYLQQHDHSPVMRLLTPINSVSKWKHTIAHRSATALKLLTFTCLVLCNFYLETF